MQAWCSPYGIKTSAYSVYFNSLRLLLAEISHNNYPLWSVDSFIIKLSPAKAKENCKFNCIVHINRLVYSLKVHGTLNDAIQLTSGYASCSFGWRQTPPISDAGKAAMRLRTLSVRDRISIGNHMGFECNLGNNCTSNRQSNCTSDSECNLWLLWVQLFPNGTRIHVIKY